MKISPLFDEKKTSRNVIIYCLVWLEWDEFHQTKKYVRNEMRHWLTERSNYIMIIYNLLTVL